MPNLESPLGTPTPQARESLAELTVRSRSGLLIATDGRQNADAAVIVGASIAQRLREPYELLAVESIELMQDDVRATPGSPHPLHLRLSQQRARTTDMAEVNWPLAMAYGDAGDTIADYCDQTRRRMIVLGLHVYTRVDRLLGRETVLQVLRRATCPVLAVDNNRRTLPRRALLAIDFSPSSIAAAREALRVVGDGGVVYLAHVLPRSTIPFNVISGTEDNADASAMLRDVAQRLGIPPRTTTHVSLLTGDPVRALAALAYQEGLELIATGSRGFSHLRGPVVGRVPTGLIHAAPCSVLVVPPGQDIV